MDNGDDDDFPEMVMKKLDKPLVKLETLEELTDEMVHELELRNVKEYDEARSALVKEFEKMLAQEDEKEPVPFKKVAHAHLTGDPSSNFTRIIFEAKLAGSLAGALAFERFKAALRAKGYTFTCKFDPDNDTDGPYHFSRPRWILDFSE